MTADPADRVAAAAQDRVLDTALEYIGYDTANPPGTTAELAAHIEAQLEASGLDVESIVSDPEKPNLRATLPGKTDQTLILLGHLDTVPYDEQAWRYDPLGERDGNRLYGRGATDMKGPLAAMVTVLRAFAERDIHPPVDVELVLVSDEEVAGDAGLPALLEADALDADACVIGETTCASGQHSVTVADRGSIWLTLEATGVGAHGSRPPLGENAIDRLLDTIEGLRERLVDRHLSIPDAVTPILEESIEYYAPEMGEATARDLFETPSVNLGTIDGGDAINSVPTAATAGLDIRLAPGVDTEAILTELRACVDASPGVAIADVSWSVGTYEDWDSPLVEAVTRTAKTVTDDRVYRRSATGGGDAKRLRNAGVPTVEFALGTDTAHAVDEYTTTAALSGNVQAYARLPWALYDPEAPQDRSVPPDKHEQ